MTRDQAKAARERIEAERVKHIAYYANYNGDFLRDSLEPEDVPAATARACSVLATLRNLARQSPLTMDEVEVAIEEFMRGAKVGVRITSTGAQQYYSLEEEEEEEDT